MNRIFATFAGGALLAGLMISQAAAGGLPSFNAGVECTESDTSGCTFSSGLLMSDESVLSFTFSSDGESSFDPCQTGQDTSDCISFSSDITGVTNNSLWSQLGESETWFIPASTNCGSENEPACEFVGDFLLSQAIGGITAGYFTFGEAGGGTSDWFVWGNTGPEGTGEIFIYSDPAHPTPEPLTIALFGAGLLGLGALRRRRKDV